MRSFAMKALTKREIAKAIRKVLEGQKVRVYAFQSQSTVTADR